MKEKLTDLVKAGINVYVSVDDKKEELTNELINLNVTWISGTSFTYEDKEKLSNVVAIRSSKKIAYVSIITLSYMHLQNEKLEFREVTKISDDGEERIVLPIVLSDYSRLGNNDELSLLENLTNEEKLKLKECIDMNR